MKKVLVPTLLAALSFSLHAAEKPLMFSMDSGNNMMATEPTTVTVKSDPQLATMEMGTQHATQTIRLNVKGQGVAPTNTLSPAQAYALAKRAAIADCYRLLAEKIKGVRVEGQDLIKNAMVTRSQVRTQVDALIAQATVIETTFADGLCEVEMELIIDTKQWKNSAAR